MAEQRLQVPLVPQSQGMSCWYASACMVAYHFEAGPRLGLPDKWASNKGIKQTDFVSLARAEGLVFLPSKDHDFTAASLIATLFFFGPIWCACVWKGYGHVVVLTGCSTSGDGGGTVYFNDPEPVDVGSRDSVSIETLNTKRARGGMLVRPWS